MSGEVKPKESVKPKNTKPKNADKEAKVSNTSLKTELNIKLNGEMSVDAASAAITRVAKLSQGSEGIEFKTQGTVVLTGATPYKVHIFEANINVKQGKYVFNFMETRPNTESLAQDAPENPNVR